MKGNLAKFVLPVIVLVGCAALVALFAGSATRSSPSSSG
jgi:hypothetical protein